jgi:hypothetical protein
VNSLLSAFPGKDRLQITYTMKNPENLNLMLQAAVEDHVSIEAFADAKRPCGRQLSVLDLARPSHLGLTGQ